MAEVTDEELADILAGDTRDSDDDSSSMASSIDVDTLTDKELEEIRAAFDLFDKDGDGSISVSELGTVMKSMGLSPSEKDLDYLVNETDIDGDGEIDFNEFLRIMVNQLKDSDSEQRIAEAFKVFDKEGHGYVSAVELRHVLTNMGEKLTEAEADEMIKAVDLDGDGLINCDEFVAMLKKQ